MLRSEQSRNPVSQQDVQVLIGIVATVTGEGRGGHTTPDTTAKFATRFVNAGLLDREPDGTPPSSGKVAHALEDLVQRLRYAYGEYDEEPRPLPSAIVHVLALPSQEAARRCQHALPDGQVRDAVIHHDAAEGWLLFAVYPELPPDQDFNEREVALRRTPDLAGLGWAVTVTSTSGRLYRGAGSPRRWSPRNEPARASFSADSTFPRPRTRNMH